MIYVGIAATAVIQMVFMLYNIISCIPRRHQTYLEAGQSHKCTVNALTVGIAQSAIYVAIDFYILYIPLEVVWGLQLSMRRKIGISAIFLTGLL